MGWSHGTEPGTRRWVQNRTCEKLQVFVNQETGTKRILVSNAAGRDMNTNTGRKSLANKQYVRIGGIVHQYNTLPIKQYLILNLNLLCLVVLIVP